MKVIGNLDLGQNEIQNVVIDSTEEFPANPKTGQFLFKDGRVMACVQISEGIPVWVPMTQEITAYIHTQETDSTTWTVSHGFNNKNVIVQVSTDTGEVIIPDAINLVDPDTAEITLSSPMSGTAVVMLGTFYGVNKPNVAYSMEFANMTSITVNHNLGYNPAIRVYVGSVEVQPQSITHDSVNQATVTFNTAQTGEIRCI